MMEIFAMVEANYPEIHKTNFVINGKQLDLTRYQDVTH